MSKAILIMDMPSSCLHCSCSNIMHGRSRCEETGENLTLDDIYEERPKHCPLRGIARWQTVNKCKHKRKCGFYRAFGYCIKQIGEECIYKSEVAGNE